MHKVRNVKFLVIMASCLFMAQCNGMFIVRAGWRAPGKCIKYGIPTATMIALVIYNAYHYFSTLRSLKGDARDLKRDTRDLKRDTQELKEGMRDANRKLDEMDPVINEIKEDTTALREQVQLVQNDTQDLIGRSERAQESLDRIEVENGEIRGDIERARGDLSNDIAEQERILSALIRESKDEVKEDFEERFHGLQEKLDEMHRDLLQCADKDDVRELSELITSVDGKVVAMRGEILERIVQLGNGYEQRFAQFEEQLANLVKGNDDIKALLDTKDEEYRELAARIVTIGQGVVMIQEYMKNLQK